MSSKKAGIFRRVWNWLRSPSKMALGSLIGIGLVAGVIGVVGFNGTMHQLNSNEFCVSCHEMNTNVYQEYMMSAHYQNATGVQATCSDCHIPKEFAPMMTRKVMALKEVYGHYVTGIIDTPTKFNEHRRAMAESEWARMKANDSQECRNCHVFDFMDLREQKTTAASYHTSAIEDGSTCIDCHKGIAHTLPDMTGVHVGF